MEDIGGAYQPWLAAGPIVCSFATDAEFMMSRGSSQLTRCIEFLCLRNLSQNLLEHDGVYSTK